MVSAAQLTHALRERLSASHVEVIDETDQHAGHAAMRVAGGDHYAVVIVDLLFLPLFHGAWLTAAVISAARLDDKGNYSFATYPPEQVGSIVEQVAEAKPDAIAIVCTNFRGAPIAEQLEKATGIPVLDSVAVTAAHCLREVGLDPAEVTGWGSVFRAASLKIATNPP